MGEIEDKYSQCGQRPKGAEAGWISNQLFRENGKRTCGYRGP